MSKLPLITVKDFEKLLFDLGFDGNQVLARPLTRQILREIEITPEEFGRLIK